MAVSRINPHLTQDLADAAGRDEQVVLWCLSCGRSTDARAAVILGLLGALPFGMVVDKLRCQAAKGGCGDNLCIVLPWYAPNPRAWAKQYKPPSEPERIYHDPPARHFRYQVEAWGKNDVLIETTTLTKKLEVAEFAFEAAAASAKPDDRFTLRNGLRLLRDSTRPFTVIG